jgi:uncharacterized protein (TIGR03086 family)
VAVGPVSDFIKTEGAALPSIPAMDTTATHTTPTDRTPTDSTATRYASAEQPLRALLDAVPADRWSSASPCEGWTARDVVRHLLETQRDFLTGHGADLGPAPDVDGDPAAAWREHAARVAAALTDESLPATAFEGHFGPTTVGETLVRFYGWDMVVHRWDLARATGVPTRLTETELDRIEEGARGFGPALYMEGVCRDGVRPRVGADRETRVLAVLGRES